MRFTLAPFVMAAIATLCSVSALAQTTPEPRPLQAMPYSPSLDLTSLDRKVDPCTNFYGFTCGGWVAGHRIPEDQASWSVYAKLAADNQQFLWGILEEDAKASDRTPVQQKVGDYFAACMDTAAIDAAGLQPLRPALDRIASLTTRDRIAAAIPWLRRDVPGSFFFGSGTEQDSIDASLVIVSVEAADLGLPDRDYYLKTDPASIAIREQYRSFVVQLLVLGGEPPAEAGADAVAIVALETELAKASLTRVDLRDPHATYHPMPIAELSALVPSVDWTAYFAAQGVAAQGPGRVRKINVSQPALLRAVQLQLATAPLAQLRAYLRFHALAGAAPALSQPFAQASFDFYSHTLRGVVAMPPRWKTCVRAADRDLGEALGQEFVRRTFDADTRAKTLRMAEQIETAMDGEIRSLDWMGAATKVEALRKLHVVRNKIGYPDTWRDYGALTVARDDHFGNVQRAGRFEDARQWAKLGKPVDLAEWSMTPPTVNAYFDPQKNDINFPAGVLQPPLYDARLDDAPNYGNTGAHHRPRADACLRRCRPAIRRRRQPARLVDAGGRQGLRGARRLRAPTSTRVTSSSTTSTSTRG